MLLVYDEEQKFKKNFYLHISQEGTINAVEKLGSGYSDLVRGVVRTRFLRFLTRCSSSKRR